MKSVLILALLASSPASAHCYKFWHFKTPQHCATSRIADPPDRSYYVEIAPLPPVMVAAAAQPEDARTPAQIADFDEHYIELAKHHDEINRLMTILRVQEDALHATGLEVR